MLRRLIGTGFLALSCQQAMAGEATSRAAAEYPSRPIRIVVPSSTGGGMDTLARVFGPKMTATCALNFARPVCG
jgi:tripartite-type tricarboxylate transporter receptor subunit TctC